jgi:hypothetical protein
MRKFFRSSLILLSSSFCNISDSSQVMRSRLSSCRTMRRSLSFSMHNHRSGKIGHPSRSRRTWWHGLASASQLAIRLGPRDLSAQRLTAAGLTSRLRTRLDASLPPLLNIFLRLAGRELRRGRAGTDVKILCLPIFQDIARRADPGSLSTELLISVRQYLPLLWAHRTHGASFRSGRLDAACRN